MGLNEAWANWVKDEHEFQQANLAAIRKFPVTPFHDITDRALGSVSRAYYDPATKTIFAAFNYPGVVGHVGSIDIDTGAVHRIVPIKGPAIHTVASLAWDPETRTLFYTTDNNAWRDLMRLDPGDGQDAPADEGRAHRRPRLQQGRQVAARHPPPERDLHARPDPGALHAVGAGLLVAVRDDGVRPRRLARRAIGLSRRSATSRASRRCA